MPEIGEEKIEYRSARMQLTHYTWLSCLDCGKCRWVETKSLKRRTYTGLCNLCRGRRFIYLTHTPEAIKKNRLSRTGGTTSLLGTKLSDFHRSQISIGLRNSDRTWTMLDETKRKISLTLMGHPDNLTEEGRERIATACRNRIWLDASRAKSSATRKNLLTEHPEMIKHSLAFTSEPNKTEQRLLEIVKHFGFKFVGGGQKYIGYMVPDFWNGDHKLIEMFGDYWHRGDNPQDKIDAFAKYGYSCLVIWEHELKDSKAVSSRVKEFVNA